MNEPKIEVYSQVLHIQVFNHNLLLLDFDHRLLSSKVDLHNELMSRGVAIGLGLAMGEYKVAIGLFLSF